MYLNKYFGVVPVTQLHIYENDVEAHQDSQPTILQFSPEFSPHIYNSSTYLGELKDASEEWTNIGLRSPSLTFWLRLHNEVQRYGRRQKRYIKIHLLTSVCTDVHLKLIGYEFQRGCPALLFCRHDYC